MSASELLLISIGIAIGIVFAVAVFFFIHPA